MMVFICIFLNFLMLSPLHSCFEQVNKHLRHTGAKGKAAHGSPVEPAPQAAKDPAALPPSYMASSHPLQASAFTRQAEC